MDTAIAVREVAPVVWTQEQVDLIKRMVAKEATNDELALFIHVAQKSGLDPLAKQIYCIHRKDGDGPKNMAIQTGIDGYRLIADRTGLYAGSDEPVYSEKIGDAFPYSATVTVYKLVNKEPRPFSATAHWAEYYPGEGKPGFMWRKMPRLMLGKCAESLALRKAFPQELSGVFTHEEMDQADRPMPTGNFEDDFPRAVAYEKGKHDSKVASKQVSKPVLMDGKPLRGQMADEENQRLDMLAYVKQELDEVVRPLKHAGIWNAILWHSFNVTNKDMAGLSLDALKSGIMLFDMLVDDLEENGLPDNLLPDEWVQTVIRKMAEHTSTISE